MRRLFTFAVAHLTACSAIAQGLSSSAPGRSFCPLGAEIGLPTGVYSVNDIPGCSSPPKPVTPTANTVGLRNTLAFYALGNFDKPERLDDITLMLNVNTPSEAKTAYPHLQHAASELAAKLLGKNAVPADLETAVTNGGTRRWRVKTWAIEVKRTDWRPNSNGHQVTVRFKPAGAK
ncbi:hypothetical protein AAFF27_00880 [Xylophilus sp. GW821-FHT01B05]